MLRYIYTSIFISAFITILTCTFICIFMSAFKYTIQIILNAYLFNRFIFFIDFYSLHYSNLYFLSIRNILFIFILLLIIPSFRLFHQGNSHLH